ncbi:MAG: Hpt domain-containing protein [bacterium]
MTEQTNASVSDDVTLPATDAASLDRLKRFGGGKLLSEMIALFLEGAPERMAAARAAVESNDVKAAEMALHSLKSSSAQLGALRMQRLCEKGELIARAGTLDNVAELVAALDEEFPRVQSWLERARHPEVA